MGGSQSAYSIQDQQKVNPDFSETGKKGAPSFEDVERVLKKIRHDWGVSIKLRNFCILSNPCNLFQIASICDIVLNHTANESKWIYENPEASYSSFTTHHLRPAILLDAMLAKVSADVAAGLLATVGVPEVIENDDHLQVFVGL